MNWGCFFLCVCQNVSCWQTSRSATRASFMSWLHASEQIHSSLMCYISSQRKQCMSRDYKKNKYKWSRSPVMNISSITWNMTHGLSLLGRKKEKVGEQRCRRAPLSYLFFSSKSWHRQGECSEIFSLMFCTQDALSLPPDTTCPEGTSKEREL